MNEPFIRLAPITARSHSSSVANSGTISAGASVAISKRREGAFAEQERQTY